MPKIEEIDAAGNTVATFHHHKAVHKRVGDVDVDEDEDETVTIIGPGSNPLVGDGSDEDDDDDGPEYEEVSMVSFWGVEVKPGDVPSTFQPPFGCCTHITQATLGHADLAVKAGQLKQARVMVTCSADGCKSVVCSLREGAIENASLNLQLMSPVELTVSGPFSVFLSGFNEVIQEDPVGDAELNQSIQDNGYGDVFGLEDDEDLSDDERFAMAVDNGELMGSEDDESEGGDSDDAAFPGGVGFMTQGAFPPIGTTSSASASTSSSSANANANAKPSAASEPAPETGKKRDRTTGPAASPAVNAKKAKVDSNTPVTGAIDGAVDEPKKSKKDKKKEKKQQQQAGQPVTPAKQPKAADTPAVTPAGQQSAQKGKQAKPHQSQDEKKQPEASPDNKQQQKKKEKKQQDDEPKVVKLQGGLQYQDLQVGTGAVAKNGNKLSMRYRGVLTKNGKEFDSNMPRGKPFEFTLGIGEVIKGWDLGLNGMREGGKRRLVIPAALGYGARGAGRDIPPNSSLSFDVELLKVKGRK